MTRFTLEIWFVHCNTIFKTNLEIIKRNPYTHAHRQKQCLIQPTVLCSLICSNPYPEINFENDFTLFTYLVHSAGRSNRRVHGWVEECQAVHLFPLQSIICMMIPPHRACLQFKKKQAIFYSNILKILSTKNWEIWILTKVLD